MDFLPLARRQLIELLWKRFKGQLETAEALEEDLNDQAMGVALDHLAIIDLPSPQSGIPVLERIFSTLGFVKTGKGLVKDKANEFIWMEEEGARESVEGEPLPQIVLADFRVSNLSPAVSKVVERLTKNLPQAPFAKIEAAAKRARGGEFSAVGEIVKVVSDYLTRRDHLLPTKQELELVRQENELLAWVMVFGREVNHFGVSAHHLHAFPDLESFTNYIEADLGFDIVERGGKRIRGSRAQGIQQSATTSEELVVELEGGQVTLPNRFIELVWRFPSAGLAPELWSSYFRGFATENSDTVIESLYKQPA